MTTYDNGCVETPEWSLPKRPEPDEPPTIPLNITLSDN